MKVQVPGNYTRIRVMVTSLTATEVTVTVTVYRDRVSQVLLTARPGELRLGLRKLMFCQRSCDNSEFNLNSLPLPRPCRPSASLSVTPRCHWQLTLAPLSESIYFAQLARAHDKNMCSCSQIDYYHTGSVFCL